METNKNADRFTGFADAYDAARPGCPAAVTQILRHYLNHAPVTVVDLGCGTGLSTLVWQDAAEKVIGVEPSDDMRAVAVARAAGCANIEFIKAFADCTGLPGGGADIVTCSQSFHWMEPTATLAEVSRLLRPGGIFAAYDCDWPPVCSLRVETAYEALLGKVRQIESADRKYKDAFIRYPKEQHLGNIKACGHFKYAREVLFMNWEHCDAARYDGIALSQGGLQAVLRQEPELVRSELETFRAVVEEEFAGEQREIAFCYRMRLGIK